jgi:hypothetical protein
MRTRISFYENLPPAGVSKMSSFNINNVVVLCKKVVVLGNREVDISKQKLVK